MRAKGPLLRPSCDPAATLLWQKSAAVPPSRLPVTHIAVASSARRQGQGHDEGGGWLVLGPEKVELDLDFVRARVNQDDWRSLGRLGKSF